MDIDIDVQAIRNCIRLAAEARETGHTGVERAALEATRIVVNGVAARAAEAVDRAARAEIARRIPELEQELRRLAILRDDHPLE